MIEVSHVIEETESEFHQRIGAPDWPAYRQIEGTILVDTGLPPLSELTVGVAAVTFRDWSPGVYDDDTAEVRVDYSGQIVYAVERDATGQRRWWFAGSGTVEDSASQRETGISEWVAGRLDHHSEAEIG